MKYIVSHSFDKVTGEKFYYCHLEGYPYVPCFGSIGTKQHAENFAKMMNRSKGK